MNHQLPSTLHALQRFGSILVAGPDARSFLHGQLSFDMSQLTSGRVELASCNSPQGRVQAVAWLLERSDGLALILPAELVDATVARLRKYVLRAKVTIDAGSERFTPCGTADPMAMGLERAHIEIEGASFIRWPGASHRVLALVPEPVTTFDAAFEQDWHLQDIRAGLPQVYGSTHEHFVAQMLNLDLLGGISFEKGCYTGQEVIARTHFRGSVKRRMFHFRAGCAAPPPGTRIVAAGAHAGDVVDAVTTADGCELLAVVSLGQIDGLLELAEIPGSALERLSLPYEVQ